MNGEFETRENQEYSSKNDRLNGLLAESQQKIRFTLEEMLQFKGALRNLAVEMKSHFNGRPTKYIDNDSLVEKTITGPVVCGSDSPDWIAIDFGNVLVHLFLPESRLYYNLEEIWTMAPDEG